MTSSRAFITAAALTLVTAAPAAGAWQAPQPASTGAGDAASPDVAVNARGDALMAWVQDRGGSRRVVASVRPAGGEWEVPRTVSPPGRSAADPRVALGPGGRMVVLWRQVLGTRTIRQGGRATTQALYVARARERTVAARRWGATATLSSPRQKVGPPAVAIDRAGVAIATWHWGTGTRPGGPGYVGEVQTSESRRGRAWTTPRRVSASADCRGGSRLPDIAAGPDGHVAVWWECLRGPARGTVAAIGRGPAAGAWSRWRTLAVGTDAGQVLRIAVGPGGRVLAAGTHAAPSRIAGGIRWWRGVTGRGGLSLSRVGAPPAATSTRAGDAVAVSLDPAGAGLAAWTRPSGALAVADVPPAGDVGAPEELGDPAARLSSPAAGVAAGGRGAIVAVTGAGGAGARVTAFTRTAGGAWSEPQPLSAPGAIGADGSPRLGIDASGGAVAVWSRRDGGRNVVERAAFRPDA